jgi:hypothetical protein
LQLITPTSEQSDTGIKVLEVKVHIEIHVVILFGLEIFASVFGSLTTAIGVIMENSIAMFSLVMACVWCGIAFLRSSGEKKFQPK